MNAGLSCESWIGIRQSLMQGTNRLALIRRNFWPTRYRPIQPGAIKNFQTAQQPRDSAWKSS
jgi:hypothetical protein